MSILQNRATLSLFGALTAIALGLSLAATGSASAQKFQNAAMAPSNGAEILAGFPHAAIRDASTDRCAATDGAEILSGFKPGAISMCR